MHYRVRFSDKGSSNVSVDVAEGEASAGDPPRSVTIGTRPRAVETLARGATRRTFLIDGHVVNVFFGGPPTEMDVSTEAYRGNVAVESARAGRRASGEMRAVREKVLVAPMPGRIVKLAVGAGDKVTQGATLLVIEAMKMENDVRAKHDGLTVATVHVALGDTVEAGAKLLTFE